MRDPNASRRSVLLGGFVVAWTIGGLARPADARAAERAVQGPPIIDCAGWGARPNQRVIPVWDQRPVRILVHHTATPNVGTTAGAPRSAGSRDPELPHGPARLDRHRPALHGQPRRVRPRGAAPQPRDAARRAPPGRGRALHRAERRGRRDRERGHLHDGRAAGPAVGPAAGPVRLHLPAVRDPADGDHRAPRLQGHDLPRRLPLRDAAAAARRGGGRARERLPQARAGGRHGRCCAPATGDPPCARPSTCCAPAASPR